MVISRWYHYPSGVPLFLLRRTLCTWPRGTDSRDSRGRRDSRDREMDFQLQWEHNPVTGNSEWVVIPSLPDGPPPKSRPLVSTSYLDMLNDHPRNQAFHAAIRKALRKLGPCHVLDIGAGTCLLSMMALRAMQELQKSGVDTGRVTACEAFLPMFMLGRKSLKANGMSSNIKLVNKRSEDMSIGLDVQSRADMLVSEILDSELLGEGFLPTLKHAQDNLLKPNAFVVPYKATIFGQLAECKLLWQMNDLHGVEALAQDSLVLDPGIGQHAFRLKPKQYAYHVDTLMDDIKLASDPFEVFTFEFSEKVVCFRDIDLTVQTNGAKVAHIIISWWVLQLDEEGSILYSTAPKWVKTSDKFAGNTCWREHWKPCVWFLPQGSVMLPDERVLKIRASHDALSFKYEIFSENMKAPNFMKRAEVTDEQKCLMVTPERIGMLGSVSWRTTILQTMNLVLLQKSSNVLCLVIDDSLPLIIAAATVLKNSSVLALLPGIRTEGAHYLRIAAEGNIFPSGQVKILNKSASELTISELGGRKVDVLLAEPYYRSHESMLPWQNLRFWNERSGLKELLDDNAVIIPSQGILRGMAVYAPDLWQSRRSLKDVEGFDHSEVNMALGACGDTSPPAEQPILPYTFWQCGETKELTEPFSIMTFDLSRPIETAQGSAEVAFHSSGICHAIILWIDWAMLPNKNVVLSTGPKGSEPTFWKQGIKLFSSPLEVQAIHTGDDLCTSPTMLKVSGLFDSLKGELAVDVSFRDCSCDPK